VKRAKTKDYSEDEMTRKLVVIIDYRSKNVLGATFEVGIETEDYEALKSTDRYEIDWTSVNYVKKVK